MNRIYKIALMLSLATLIPTVTVYAATVLTLTTPASVTVVLPPGLTMYPYTGTFPTLSCGTTSVSSIAYGNVPQGTRQTVYECLEDTGSTSYYITSSSFSTDLSSSVGTIAATYYLSGSSTPQSPPIFLVASNELLVAFDLSITSSAALASTNFNIVMQVFSTSTG